MTRYLIGLFLMAILLARPAAAQTTTSSTSTSSSTSSTSTSTTTSSSTSSTAPCIANGLPCALDVNCCSGFCNDFSLCQAVSTTSTSTSSTTTTSAAPTTTVTTTSTSTSNTNSTTTTSTSTSTTTTIIVYDHDGALFAGATTTGTSQKILRFEPNRPQAITFHAVIASTGTIQIEQSLDGGTTWTKIGSDITSSSMVTFEHPTGLIRGKISACSGCTATLWWSMQRNP